MEKQKNERILLSEFAKKYNGMNSTEAKKQYVKSIVKRTYCPILEKKLILDEALNNSIRKTDFNKEYIDMFVSQINFTAAIILIYTNLYFGEGEKVNVFEAYDILIANHLLDPICAVVGDEELQELANVQKTIMDTYYNKQL